MKLPVLSQSELRGSDRYFSGQAAVDEVERRIGRELDAVEAHLVKEEGFVVGKYLDDKNIETAGVGQTRGAMDLSFDELMDTYEDETRGFIPSYDNQPDDVRIALFSANYRGDLRQSPTFRDLFNEGRYAEAAEEFLDHDEYRERLADGGDGVTARLEGIASAVAGLANQEEPIDEFTDALPSYEEDTESGYTVQPGDSLYRIAAENGIDMEDLMRANNILDANRIQAGQVLVLPMSPAESDKGLLEKGYDYAKSQVLGLFN